MPWWIAGAAIGGALLGDVIGAEGQADTNAMNLQIHREDNNAALQRQQDSQGFNNLQGYITREFNSAEALKNREFQMSTLQESERYNTEMSNTAMQRRAEDLRRAGINPLLAVSQGGASTPTVSSLTGSAASAGNVSSSAAGAPGPIAMQNPNAAFGNLGGILGTAIGAAKTQADIDYVKAQTAKTEAETNNKMPAEVEYIKAMTGATNATAQQTVQNINWISENWENRKIESQYNAYNAVNQEKISDFQAQIAGQNRDVLVATKDALIAIQNNEAVASKLGLEKLKNLSDIQKSDLGKYINWINAILQPAVAAKGLTR